MHGASVSARLYSLRRRSGTAGNPLAFNRHPETAVTQSDLMPKLPETALDISFRATNVSQDLFLIQSAEQAR